jgi:hypothetical protein
MTELIPAQNFFILFLKIKIYLKKINLFSSIIKIFVSRKNSNQVNSE